MIFFSVNVAKMLDHLTHDFVNEPIKAFTCCIRVIIHRTDFGKKILRGMFLWNACPQIKGNVVAVEQVSVTVESFH